jgi:hypothetical protein
VINSYHNLSPPTRNPGRSQWYTVNMMQLANDRGAPSQSNQFQLEPDLLPVMQMLFTLQAALQSVGLMVVLVQERFVPTLMVLELLALGILLIYVYWPGLPDLLGRWFLPPVVIYYSALSIIHRYLFVAFVLPEMIRPVAGAPDERMMILDSGWSLLVALLIPLVLVAWQYDFAHVLWYCAGITLFELPLMVLAPHPAHITFFDMLTMVGMRAVVFAMVGYIVTRMIGAQRAQRRELTEANARLQHAATTLEQLTISRERNRMARETARHPGAFVERGRRAAGGGGQCAGKRTGDRPCVAHQSACTDAHRTDRDEARYARAARLTTGGLGATVGAAKPGRIDCTPQRHDARHSVAHNATQPGA